MKSLSAQRRWWAAIDVDCCREPISLYQEIHIYTTLVGYVSILTGVFLHVRSGNGCQTVSCRNRRLITGSRHLVSVFISVPGVLRWM